MLGSRRSAWSVLFEKTDRLDLAPFDDQGYPLSLIMLSANRSELDLRRLPRVQKLGVQLSLVIK